VLKRFVKRLARPFTRRLMARVDARVASVRDEIQSELAPLGEDLATIRQHFGPLVARAQTHDRLTSLHTQAVSELREQMSSINEYLPMLLNTISSQNAAAREARRTELELREAMRGFTDGTVHVHKRLDELGSMLAERIADVERRGEFIRNEVLFEARYGGREKGMASVSESKVMAPDKLAKAGSEIRLNLGCGHIPMEGYLNVDGRPLEGVDIVAEVGDLPFETATVTQIHSAHLLEHFPVEELRRRLLPYWFDLLLPGGTFTAVVPDPETMIDEYVARRFSFEDLRLVTFGEQEYEGDFHFNMFSKDSLKNLLGEAGFSDVRIVESGRRNGACYEMEVAARRPAADA
jgi:hypothetical protein